MVRSENSTKEHYMTDSKQQQTANNTAASNAPSLVAYQVREVKEGKDFWTRIGSAWSHKDGKGFTVQLDAVPLDGRVTLRRPEEKPANQVQTGGRKSRAAQPAPV
jgi:hypothetical protein